MKHAVTSAAGIAPVAIGGVGGSGTRLVAAFVRELGFHLGDDLNAANDTLWFTLLFKWREVLQCDEAEFDLLTGALCSALAGGRPATTEIETLVSRLAGMDRPQHSARWLQQRRDTLLAAAGAPGRSGPWGWKEPNTHVVIERLWQRLPGLRYIHVVRNGLDMAYSSNQNQLDMWGPQVLGSDGSATPARALAYWCRVHERMLALQRANPGRMHWLDYDALCHEPQTEAARLCEFLGCRLEPASPVLATVRKPDPAQRLERPLADLDQADLKLARRLARV